MIRSRLIREFLIEVKVAVKRTILAIKFTVVREAIDLPSVPVWLPNIAVSAICLVDKDVI